MFDYSVEMNFHEYLELINLIVSNKKNGYCSDKIYRFI